MDNTFGSLFTGGGGLDLGLERAGLKGVYLDELDENQGVNDGPICDECGIFCELIKM